MKFSAVPIPINRSIAEIGAVQVVMILIYKKFKKEIMTALVVNKPILRTRAPFMKRK
jgi:hypothetical protein